MHAAFFSLHNVRINVSFRLGWRWVARKPATKDGFLEKEVACWAYHFLPTGICICFFQNLHQHLQQTSIFRSISSIYNYIHTRIYKVSMEKENQSNDSELYNNYTSWWFQPISKIWISEIGSLPQVGVKIKKMETSIQHILLPNNFPSKRLILEHEWFINPAWERCLCSTLIMESCMYPIP